MKTKKHPDFLELTVETEQSLIGGVLLQPSMMPAVRQVVSVLDFVDPDLRELFAVLCDMADANEPFHDVVCLVPRLKTLPLWSPGRMDSARLASMATNATVSLVFVAHDIARAAARRRLQQISDDLQAELSAPAWNDDPADVARRYVERLSTTAPPTVDVVAIRDVAAKMVTDMGKSDTPVQAAETGLADMDQAIGGFLPGDMVVIAGRPGMGKSSLAAQIGCSVAENGQAVVVISLEMTAEEYARRELCARADVDSRFIRRNDVTDREIQRMANILPDIPDLYRCWAPSGATLSQIRAIALLEARRGTLGLLVIDHIGLIKGDRTMRDRYQEVQEISKSIKQLAKELQIPIVCLCQLNREADGKQPTLAMLRESGSIEQDADMVLFLHAVTLDCTHPPKLEHQIFIGKARHGATGRIPNIVFDAPHQRFVRDPRLPPINPAQFDEFSQKDFEF